MTNKIKNYYLNIFISIESTFFLFMLINRDILLPSINGTDYFLSLIICLVILNIFVIFLNSITKKSIYIRYFAGLLLVWFYSILALYHTQTNSYVEYSVLVENFGIVFKPGAFSVISSILSRNKKYFLYFLLISYTMGYLYVHYISRNNIDKNKEISVIKKIIFSALIFSLWYGLAASSLKMKDEFSIFIQKCIHYYTRENIIKDPIPYTVKPSINASGDFITEITPYSDYPNIIFLMVESFNTKYIEALTENGTPITPVFNKLMHEGYYVDNFYSPTIQSSRGQFSSLFSQLPSVNSKIFVENEDSQYFGLADALSTLGYESFLVKAYKDITFDNTKSFLEKHGYNDVFSLHDLLSEEDAQFASEWGVQDKVLYNYFPEIIGRINRERENRPFFLTLHTVMSHNGFDSLPTELNTLYPKASNMHEHYSNNIHVADDQLLVFIDKLNETGLMDNSIIIISGDHSFPTGDHGITGNEVGFYEESFKTPFLLLAKDHLKPYREKVKRFTQMDIGPTLLDLVGSHEIENNFQGQSMLRINSISKPILLTQPYHGKMFISIRYPFKYLYQVSTGSEILFNLENDPNENNIISIKELAEDKLKLFREDIQYIFNNQALIENDNMSF